MNGQTGELRRRLVAGILLAILAGPVGPALAQLRTFPAGSLVIPVDRCWQPQETLPAARGCAAGGSDAGLAEAYGLAYRLQRAGVPVYLAGPAELSAISFVVAGAGTAPALELPGGAELAPPARSAAEGVLDRYLVDYRGMPFIIDIRDLNEAGRTLLTASPLVKIHQLRVPFVAPIVRQLTGLPVQLAVNGATAAAGLRPLLALAGIEGPDGLTLLADGSLPAGAAVLSCPAEPTTFALQTGSCGLPAIFAALYAVPSSTVPQEVVSTAPVIADGTLYVASAVFPGRSGHLRAFSLRHAGRYELWDAAERVPVPGDVLLPPAVGAELAPPLAAPPGERLLFTSLGRVDNYRLVRLDSAAAAALAPQLGSAGVTEAAALLNSLRGRLGTSAAVPQGTADRGNRLGAISRSTPAVVGPSAYLATPSPRSRMLYVGSDAGLLHAVETDSGRELWGYLPGSLLSVLRDQPWSDPGAAAVLRVDGAPAVSDQFADFDGDGRREWRTVLVGTASADRMAAVIFALDVSEPTQPRVLWERRLDEAGIGMARGVALVAPGSDGMRPPRAFLCGSSWTRRDDDGRAAAHTGRFGVTACALDLRDGSLQWQFFAPYEGEAANLNEPPAVPALQSMDGRLAWMLFGDLTGRLWALDPHSGKAFGDGPLYRLPEGIRTPLTTGVAVLGNKIFFGSGGAEHGGAAEHALYALELLPAGVRLRWKLSLAAGEAVLSAPLLDRSGRIYAVAGDDARGSARLLVLNDQGTVAAAVPLSGPSATSPALAAGVVVSVSREGEVEQLGGWREDPPAEPGGGRVRVLSWRYR